MNISNIPAEYGLFEPTAVFVPFRHFLDNDSLTLLSTEIFGPFQVMTEYSPSEMKELLSVLDRIPHHLTGSICSNDIRFVDNILGNTVNGVTYTGILSRTTGAPQNHYFGPAGDPRSSGIGTPEALRDMWSCHRETVVDVGPLPEGFQFSDPH